MTGDDWAKVGQAVRGRRKRLDITQKDAALIADVSDTTWGKLEAGLPVGDRTVRRAAWALEWAEDWLQDVVAGREPGEERRVGGLGALTPSPPEGEISDRLAALEERLTRLEDDLRKALRARR